MIRHIRQAMWISRSLVRDLRKRKFKAIFRVLYDRHYRRDLQRMRRIIGDGYYVLEARKLPLYSIRHSHSINYPKWVCTLVDRIKGWEGLYTPPPIKVIRDWEMSGTGGNYIYMVVDGNHRLAAMKLSYSPGELIDVYEMVRDRAANG